MIKAGFRARSCAAIAILFVSFDAEHDDFIRTRLRLKLETPHFVVVSAIPVPNFLHNENAFVGFNSSGKRKYGRTHKPSPDQAGQGYLLFYTQQQQNKTNLRKHVNVS